MSLKRMRAASRHTMRIAVVVLLLLWCATAVAAPPIIVTQQRRVRDGMVGAGWGPVFLRASGGAAPLTWSVSQGSLPPGVTLSPDGRIEGTTTAQGVFRFTVQVSDASHATATQSLRVRVHPRDGIRTPPLTQAQLPFGYVQSAFFLGADATYTKDEQKALLRLYRRRFTGGEVFFDRVETAADFQSIRDFNAAIAEVRAEPGGGDFVGVFSNGRLPGFSQPADLAALPPTWLPIALKSDGSPWVRRPDPPSQLGSVFGLHADVVDITNTAAVDAVIRRVAVVYDHEGDKDASVGPLNGLWVFNEGQVSGLYLPFSVSTDPNAADDDDLQPRTTDALRPSCNAGWNEYGTNPPLLRGGDPCVLYADGDPRISWLLGPKRALPLFSVSARDSFVAYALAHGVTLSTLPADRDEFNDADATVQLPAHVTFVPLTNTGVWSLWHAWVNETWFAYASRLARAVTFAQAGNPWFRGVLYFQLPGWYSFGAPARDEIVPYRYYDANTAGDPRGVLQTATGALTDDAMFAVFDSVDHGIDVEQFLADPWFQGFLHETTTPIIGASVPSADRAGDLAALTSAAGLHLWNHQTAVLEKVARRHHKLFGLFARYFYFGASQMLAPADWEWNWDRLVPLYPPDVVATLPPGFYFSPADFEPAYAYLATSGWTGELGPAWSSRFGALAQTDVAPPDWNPPSLGRIDRFDGHHVGGWAFDPWSTRTEVAVELVSGPADCDKPPQRLRTISADGAAEPKRDDAIRAAIYAANKYIPPESMGFDFELDALELLQNTGIACGPGTYTLRLAALDAQGAGTTFLATTWGTDAVEVTIPEVGHGAGAASRDAVSADSNPGCACRSGPSVPSVPEWVALLILVPLGRAARRRPRAAAHRTSPTNVVSPRRRSEARG